MIDRTKAPVPEKNISFEIPELNELQLSNGTKLYFIRKEKLPIVYTDLLFLSGSKLDPADKKGLAYLTALLIDEGAGEYDSLALNGEFEKLGTVFSVSSSHDSIGLTLLSLKENLSRSIELLSKIVLEPAFEEKDFLREKKKVLDKILQLKDEPSYIAETVFEKLLFENTHYSFPEIGDEKSISAISNSDIKNFHAGNFTSSNSVFIVAGNLTQEEALEHFNKYFKNWKSGSKTSVPFLKPEPKPTSFYIVDKKDSAQSEIRVGHLAKKRNSPDYMPARIMNAILGGQFSSRINLNLREAKGFTYGAGSAFHYYQDSGLFQVSTAVNIENSAEAISEIIKELNGIRENISSKEIDFAKSYLIKQFPSRFETYAQTAKNIEQLLLHDLKIDELLNYTSKVDSATPDEILNAARENIITDKLTVLAVGDKTKLIPQITDKFNLEPVELDIYGNLLS